MDRDQVELAAAQREIAALRAENGALRARIAEVERRGPELAEALRETERLLSGLMGNLPGLVYRCTTDDAWTMTFISEGCRELTGYPEQAFLTPNREERISIVSLTPPEDQARIWKQVQAAIAAKERFQLQYRITTRTGEEKWVWEQGHGVFGPSGEAIALEGFITDVTARVRAEQEREALRESVIAAQESALRELATPLLPIAEGVLAMPLLGAIDRRRADQILETLLEGIVQQQAATALLDITGVRTIDDRSADAIARIARAARLLGARVVITGVAPAVAKTLVALGVALGGVETKSTLREGVAAALRSAAGAGATR